MLVRLIIGESVGAGINFRVGVCFLDREKGRRGERGGLTGRMEGWKEGDNI